MSQNVGLFNANPIENQVGKISPKIHLDSGRNFIEISI
jgi:hypothetical protein